MIDYVSNYQNTVNKKWKILYSTLTLFFIQNLYGAEYGVVKHYINQCSHVETSSERVFTNIIKEALGINNIHSSKEAINIMCELFSAFEIRRERDVLQRRQKSRVL